MSADPTYIHAVCTDGEVVEVNLPDNGLAGAFLGAFWTDLRGLRRADLPRNRVVNAG